MKHKHFRTVHEDALQTCTECIPCFIRQGMEALQLTKRPAALTEQTAREVLGLVAACEWDVCPPVISRRIQRLIRERTGCGDPYREMKDALNAAATRLLSELTAHIPVGMDVQEAAVRMSVAGNSLDAGAKSGRQLHEAVDGLRGIFGKTLSGDWERLFTDAARAERILFLTDNAGEIVFDRYLIEQLPYNRITAAVRGTPVINDATMEDAAAAGIDGIVPVIGNGSDAPGTILEDCSAEFLSAYDASDLVIAKGQGNYETLCAADKPVVFLFQVKCQAVARRAHAAIGDFMVLHSTRA